MRGFVRNVLLALCLVATAPVGAQVQVDTPAPKVDLPLVDGRLLRAGEMDGKVVLVLFWATWCPTCVKELPELQRFYDAYRGKGFEIVGISLDNEAAEVTDYFKEKGYTFPVAMRSAGGIKKGWGPVLATPQMVLIDRSGTVRMKHLGAIGFSGLEAQVVPLL